MACNVSHTRFRKKPAATKALSTDTPQRLLKFAGVLDQQAATEPNALQSHFPAPPSRLLAVSGHIGRADHIGFGFMYWHIHFAARYYFALLP